MSKTKKIIAMILALALALAMLTSCGKKETPDSKDPDENVSNGDTNNGDTNEPTGGNENRELNFAIQQDTGTLYPFAASGGFVSLMYAFYEPLWDFKQDGTKVNILATDWEVVSDTQYKLTIRDDVKFSNGNLLQLRTLCSQWSFVRMTPDSI